MKKKNLIILLGVILGIALLFISLVIYTLVSDLRIEQSLKNELTELTNLVNKDSSLENIETIEKKLTNYISKDEYLIVEKAYKKYLMDVLNDTKIIYNITNDEKMINILTIENIKNDGKDFLETTAFLSKVKNDLNTTIPHLISLFEIETINTYIKDKELDNYYVEFFKQVSYNDKTSEDFMKVKNSLQESLNAFNHLLNTYEEVINFLKNNKDHYEIKEDIIYFDNQNLTNTYNDLINKLNQ